MVSEERLEKLKSHMDLLEKWSKQDLINRKALERTRGLLVYVILTYGLMTPYLKGLGLTSESWREDRDQEVWRLTPSKWALVMQRPDGDKGERCSVNQGEAPSLIRPVPRYAKDVRALRELTVMQHPPKVLVHPQHKYLVALMFDDASGAGFGTLLWLQGTASIQAEHEIWTQMYSRGWRPWCQKELFLGDQSRHFY
ncbi:hypothetical protein ACA910_014291 [Epithemia clementina (nom. ined.)]